MSANFYFGVAFTPVVAFTSVDISSIKEPQLPAFVGTLPNEYIRLAPLPRIAIPQDWRALPGREHTMY